MHTSPDTVVLCSEGRWPNAASKNQKKWHFTTEIKISVMKESKNKSKTTTGQRFQNSRKTAALELKDLG